MLVNISDTSIFSIKPKTSDVPSLVRKKKIPYKRAFEGRRVHSGYKVLSLNPKCEGVWFNSSNTSS